MKRTLTFESNDCDDEAALRRAMNAESAYSGLWSIREVAIKAKNGDRENDAAIDEILTIIGDAVDLDMDYS